MYITHNIHLSLFYSLPLFFILSTGFILNDINDLEKDKINNPMRVLPSNKLSINNAIIIYYIFLAISLSTIKLFIPTKCLFIYLTLLILVINYDYIIICFPYLKNIYVGILILINFLILRNVIFFNFLIILSLVINVICKEILMDIRDLKGDGKTLAKLLGNKQSIKLIILLQIIIVVNIQSYIFIFFSISRFIIYIIINILSLFLTIDLIRFNIRKIKYLILLIVLQNIILYGLIL
jgi:4-hydroxybenzoate polyprenyltransferase